MEIFYFCFILYEKQCSQTEPHLKFKIKDGREAPLIPSIKNLRLWLSIKSFKKENTKNTNKT